MENYPISFNGTEIRIEGFPDAVKVIALEGPKPKRLADLALHKADLEFAMECLRVLPQASEEPSIHREALWRSAILHYFKCFGDGCRFRLVAKQVYRSQPTEAMNVYSYFKNLRNKHLVHDENSYTQGSAGAILNNGAKSYKIEKVVCNSTRAVTLDQAHYSSLVQLVDCALAWVVSEFEELCNQISADLEKQPYSILSSRPSLSFRAPTVEDAAKKR